MDYEQIRQITNNIGINSNINFNIFLVMKATETRIVEQEWHETDTTKTGWDSHGWVFKDDRQPIDNNWTVVNHLDSDKYYNPLLGIAQKETVLF